MTAATSTTPPTPPSLGSDDALDRIKRLQRELYGREESEDLQNRSEELTHLGLRRTVVPVTHEPHDPVHFTDMAAQLHQRRRRIIIWTVSGGVLLAIFAATVAATLWYRVRQNVTDEQIAISVTGPEEFTSGDRIVYDIAYGNDSYVDWQNVEVILEAPPGFMVTDTPPKLVTSGRDYVLAVGDLPSGKHDSFQLTGRLVGEENASVVARGEIDITPVNFPSGRFNKSVLATTRVAALPVDVSISMNQQAAPGERVLSTVTVVNKSGTRLSGGYLQLAGTPGLELATDDPQFTTGYNTVDTLWMLPTLEPLASAEYTVVLVIDGAPGEQRTLSVNVGIQQGDTRFVQRTGSAVITVSAAQLGITQTYAGGTSPLTVRTGEEISGSIHYKNSGTIGLKDVVVTAALEGTAFDPASLQLKTGAYNPTTRTITWTAASVPALALLNPQDEGDIAYEFRIKKVDQFTADASSINNNLIITAGIDSPDVRVPVGQDRQPVTHRFVMPVASDILLGVDAFYDDGRLGITSTGPLPPAAGKTTSYTVRMRVGSSVNDLGDVRLIAVLEEGVVYTNKTVVTFGDVVFNERTGEIVWTIPQVKAGVGRLEPFHDLYVQIAISPGENQIGETIPFLRRLSATGTDLFTDLEIDGVVPKLPTSSTASTKGRVVE